MSDRVSSLALVFFGPDYRPTVRRCSFDRQSAQGRSIRPNALCRQHRQSQCPTGVDPLCFRSQSFTGSNVSLRRRRPRSVASADEECTGAE